MCSACYSLLADGAPPFGELDEQSFFRLSQSLDLPSLGESTQGFTDASGKTKGYLFSAYGTDRKTDPSKIGITSRYVELG